jgi:hypothetical protein
MIEEYFAVFYKVHLVAVFVAVALVLWADTIGMSWFRGQVKVLDLSKVSRIDRLVWVALSILIISGFLMFFPYREYLLQEAVFQIKLFFVATLLINGLFIRKLMRIATETPFASLNAKEKMKFLVSGGVSLIAWIVVIAAGTQIHL